MRVLITGVTGYLGGNLCEALVRAGHEVTGTSRDPERALRQVRGLAEATAWEPSTDVLSAGALRGVEAVVHLVGERVAGRWTPAKKRRIYDSRVEGTRNLVRGIEAVDERPGVLISGSAVGYYGGRGDDELIEAEPPGHDFLALVSRDWEAAAMEAAPLGVRVVPVRNGLVIGDGSPFLKAMLPLFRLRLGGRLGSGSQWWPWVHVDDVSGLIRYAIEHDTLQGPLNVTAPAPVQQREFAKALGRVLRRPAWVPAPALALKLVLGEFSTEVLTSKRVLPEAAERAGYLFAHRELEAALRDIFER